MKKFIYMESTPHLSGKARDYGRNYRRMAIVELEEGFGGSPKMISNRARGVKRVFHDYVLHVGKTERSEGYRMRERLQGLAAEMNKIL